MDSEQLRKLITNNYWYFAIRNLWREPKKFFFKYLRRILTYEGLKTIWRVLKCEVLLLRGKSYLIAEGVYKDG